MPRSDAERSRPGVTQLRPLSSLRYMPTDTTASTAATFAHAMDAFREALVLLQSAPHPEAILPTLWAFGNAGQRAGLTPRELTAVFHALCDGAETEFARGLAPGVWSEEQRARLHTVLLTVYLPAGYLATE